MNCQDVQSALSLYLYGELDFAREEEIESHLAQCAACQLSLVREKQWHTFTNAHVQEPPLDLLAQCRQQLRPALARQSSRPPVKNVSSWWRWSNPFDISFTRWSSQLAAASLLVFIGFSSARWLDRNQAAQASINPANAIVRGIQADQSGLVKILFDQQNELSGRMEDANVRTLLLSGARQGDAGVRFDIVQLLTRDKGAKQTGELRQVLFDAVRNDPNAAVRLEALEGLRSFLGDPAAVETVKFVLEHDNNPGIRYRAIDVLVPPDRAVSMTQPVSQVILDVMRSASPDDEYVRARCSRVLADAKLPVVY